MNYTDFIDEIKPLLEEARTLFDLEQLHDDPAFRKWRHRLTTTITSIEEKNYWIDCDVASRSFDIFTYSFVSKKERTAAYNRDLQDTINELETIIDHFEKYGVPQRQQDSNSAVANPKAAKESQNPAATKSDGKTLKEKFESHPVVWGLTLLAVGFGAGFTARSYLQSDTSPAAPNPTVNCSIEGLDKLEEEHHVRTEALQNQLIKFETKASDHSLISSYQDKYKEAADRIRQDISTENAAYQEAIQQLSVKCK
jgi:hypothetical protein